MKYVLAAGERLQKLIEAASVKAPPNPKISWSVFETSIFISGKNWQVFFTKFEKLITLNFLYDAKIKQIV